MSESIFLLWLVSIPFIFAQAADPSPPRGIFLNCGSSNETQHSNLKYIPDDDFTFVGNKSSLKNPNLTPILSTLRYFPDKSAKKYCYKFNVIKGEKFLIRTTYYYGGFDDGEKPPVFDQIVNGMRWTTVDTSSDYANGMSSYYEVIMAAQGNTLSVCLARNENTTSDPFISALELVSLDVSMYNSTDFSKHGLVTVTRSSFGQDGDAVSFPDDQFNRYWQPFKDQNPVAETRSPIAPSQFWNIAPTKALSKALTTSRGKNLTVKWPPFPLPRALYYVAFYFQDNRTPSPYSWRVFNISVNGQQFYGNLNVTTNGVMLYSKYCWLDGDTEIVLTPNERATVGPLINAGEIFQIFPLGGRIIGKDAVAMEEIRKGFRNPPSDWYGDPCLPTNNEWTGVKCFQKGVNARVLSLNLTNFGLIGELSKSINNLTGLTDIALGGNKLSGPIPDLGSLKSLQILHLENNQFEGSIPESLAHLPRLREVRLRNNKLSDHIPASFANSSGFSLQI